jgi:hypothetical protein
MFNFLRKSSPIEIDDLVSFLNSDKSSFKVKNCTKSAFVQKKRKINSDVFKYLTSVIIANYYTGKKIIANILLLILSTS